MNYHKKIKIKNKNNKNNNRMIQDFREYNQTVMK